MMLETETGPGGSTQKTFDAAAAIRRLDAVLSSASRLKLSHLPTPLEPMDRLSARLGGPRLWVKRDDCTGLATGGNKARKLDYLMADAKDHGADCIITQGATQSNHARQTAAAAAKLGMDCYILLEDRTGSDDRQYNYNGNVLLDQLVGATISKRPGGTDMAAEMESLAGTLRADGKTPYVVPGGGSNAIGALGYVQATGELLRQSQEMGVTIDLIVQPTGSAGTHAGMLAGLVAMDWDLEIYGISTKAPRETQEANVHKLANETLAHMGLDAVVPRDRVVANSDYVGDGYGLPTNGMCEAIGLLARLEGLLFDPVYSGKALDGLIDLTRRGQFADRQNVVFLHTGGTAALFGYPDIFDLPGYRE